MRTRSLLSLFALGAAVALASVARRRRGTSARLASPVPIAGGAVARARALGDPRGAERVEPERVEPERAEGARAEVARAEGARVEGARVEAMAVGDAQDAGFAFDLDLDVVDPTLVEALGGALLGAFGPASGGAPAGSRVEPHPYPAESLEEDLPPGEAARAAPYGARGALGGGDLYGVHVAAAADRAIPDDDLAYAEGQSWLEHLAASAAESGPAEPTLPIDALDESDRAGGHHRTATTDTPIADRGAGGPRGL